MHMCQAAITRFGAPSHYRMPSHYKSINVIFSEGEIREEQYENKESPHLVNRSIHAYAYPTAEPIVQTSHAVNEIDNDQKTWLMVQQYRHKLFIINKQS
ncbi:hypothetical protein N7495_003915 [Penicillium taxi]|uniref:uncharacterized protein n=1 Tax=Penicillium taxi TaxID=168475 RepID=UPI002545389A|nr:uncharacterized protein N7495_003915 [Penicillium taxi]KAJ5899171.1 hypothetical protein N7495_003915 [Penicillium taxi]